MVGVVLGGMVGVVDRGVHNSVVSNSMVGSVVDHGGGVVDSVVGNSMVGSVVDHGGGMVHSMVGNWGSVVDSVVSHRSGVVNSMVGSVVDHRSGVVNSMVGNRGSMMDSVVGHRSGVNCMSHRGSVDGAAGKGCEGNLGLRGSQDGGEKGSNGKCPHGVALLEDSALCGMQRSAALRSQ